MPKSNVEYWTAKIERNVKRDDQVRSELNGLGWKWRVIWECEIASGIERLSKELRESTHLQNEAVARMPSRQGEPETAN